MTDVWEQLKEHLIGEGRSVQTIAHSNAAFTFNGVNAHILSNGELVARLKLVENGTKAEFTAAQKKIPTVLAEVGYTPLKMPTDALNSIYYQKRDDPRRPQKIITLGPTQIDEITALLQDKKFTTATIGHGFAGSVDGMTVDSYALTLLGTEGERTSYTIAKKGTSVIQLDVDHLLQKHGWVKGATEIDPRGGIEGTTDYQRA